MGGAAVSWALFEDGIHLDELGQLAMGYAMLKGLGAPGEISSVEINASDSSAKATGCTVSEVTAFESTLWITEDGGYPVKAELQLGGKTTDGKDFSLALALNVTDIGKVAEITP